MARPYMRVCKHCKERTHKASDCDLAPKRVVIRPLGQEDFQRVKEAQRVEGLVSIEVAERYGFHLREVNAAFAQIRYELYLTYRRSRIAV